MTNRYESEAELARGVSDDVRALNPKLCGQQHEQASKAKNHTDYATEAEFQNDIIDYAKEHGWTKIYHTHDSRHSEAGFSDLVMLRPTKEDEFVQGVVLECKMPGAKPTKAQLEWIALWNRVPGIRARVIRPADWDEIERLLK